MRELPSGTVTLLFTDIEGSTRLLHELGDAYVQTLAEHRRLLRDAFARHGGVEVDTQRDALFYAFASAAEAAAAAEEAHRTGDHQRAPCLLGASQELRVTSGGALEPSSGCTRRRLPLSSGHSAPMG